MSSIHALDIIIWGGISLAVSVLMVLAHLRWSGVWNEWVFAHRKVTAVAYFAEVLLGLTVAFLIDRIGFRELINGDVSDLDRWLVPVFLVVVPPFVSLSVVLAIGSLEESDRARELEAYCTYVLSARDDLLRVTTCFAAALTERTKRLHELGLRGGDSSCDHIGEALSLEAHSHRLVEAIHHVFELRGKSVPVEAAMSGSEGYETTDEVSWRVALFEEDAEDYLRLVRIWDGHRDTCAFTDETTRKALFATDRKKPGMFAVACLDQAHPIIVSDTGRSRDPMATFKPIDPEQAQRIRSIAGFSLTTAPRRVVVLDSNRSGFFNAVADKPLMRQLQIIMQGQFEFEQALGAAVAAAKRRCQGGGI